MLLKPFLRFFVDLVVHSRIKYKLLYNQFLYFSYSTEKVKLVEKLLRLNCRFSQLILGVVRKMHAQRYNELYVVNDATLLPYTSEHKF